MTTTYKDLQAYFKTLAENHSAILHTDGEKHFFHSNLDQILSGLSSKVNFPAVFMADYDYSFTDNDSDNHMKSRSIALVFINHCSEDDDFDSFVPLLSQVVDCSPDQLEIDASVEVVFEDATEEITLPKFRRVTA